ncbi:hypothetical protein BH11PLA2_BH11PLA2_47460 [soil metagenome]
MPSFTCQCGENTREEDEPPGVSCVAYTLHTLAASESRIAEQILAFMAVGNGPERANWIASTFGPGYLTDATDREVIEDVLTLELNADFHALFRCPACGRIGVKFEGSDLWAFYRPE